MWPVMPGMRYCVGGIWKFAIVIMRSFGSASEAISHSDGDSLISGQILITLFPKLVLGVDAVTPLGASNKFMTVPPKLNV